MNNSLAHDPGKRDPIFGQDHAQQQESSARRSTSVACGAPSANLRSRRAAADARATAV
jgi:hypothetical protein